MASSHNTVPSIIARATNAKDFLYTAFMKLLIHMKDAIRDALPR